MAQILIKSGTAKRLLLQDRSLYIQYSRIYKPIVHQSRRATHGYPKLSISIVYLAIYIIFIILYCIIYIFILYYIYI